MRSYASLAAVSALALMAAETGSAPGAAPPNDDQLAKDLEDAKALRAETEKGLADVRQAIEDNRSTRTAEFDAAQKEADAAAKKLADVKAQAAKDIKAAEAETKKADEAKAKAVAASEAAKQAIIQVGADQAALDAAREKLAQTQAEMDAQQGAGEPDVDVDEPGARQVIVWVAPGIEALPIGMVVSVPADEAEALRGRGRARFAGDDEIAAAGEIPELSGL